MDARGVGVVRNTEQLLGCELKLSTCLPPRCALPGPDPAYGGPSDTSPEAVATLRSMVPQLWTWTVSTLNSDVDISIRAMEELVRASALSVISVQASGCRHQSFVFKLKQI